MKVVHIITRLILGGAQENTLLTCEDLRRIYGDDVLLITGPALGPEGSLIERARAGGTPLEVIPALRRAIHPWRDTASYLAIRRSLARFAPDVVHTHSGKAGLLGRSAARRLGVTAIVHTVHGAPFHPYQSVAARTLLRACERFAARRCDAIVSVANAMSDQLVAAGVAPAVKFQTVYSGLEVEPLLAAANQRAAMRRELGYTDDQIVVGKIARLFHLKGHEYLIAAAQHAVRDNPRLQFLLVGDGLLAIELRRQVERAGLSEHFRFAGLVAPEKIPAYLAAMDIVVHTSLREGLARVLPQALIAGKPVISYDVDGAREVVIPDETGCLLPPREIAGLAKAIVRLAADSELRERLGRAGRERFTNQFRHETMTAELRILYARLLAGKLPRQA
jgi:glycosyltransferase involved in cell wall biosynthesis